MQITEEKKEMIILGKLLRKSHYIDLIILYYSYSLYINFCCKLFNIINRLKNMTVIRHNLGFYDLYFANTYFVLNLQLTATKSYLLNISLNFSHLFCGQYMSIAQ